MTKQLIPYDDIQERECRGGIGITAITRLKHADLFAAAKKVGEARKSAGAGGPRGGQAAMARALNVTQFELGRWINLQTCPPAKPRGKWTAEKLLKLEASLLELTGKTLEELFPADLRENIQFLSSPKQFERTMVVEQRALAHYAEATRERLLLAQRPAVTRNLDDIKQHLVVILSSLSARERAVIEHRYGLNGEEPMTLKEIGALVGLRQERVRQIEACVINRLRDQIASGKFNNLREILSVEFE